MKRALVLVGLVACAKVPTFGDSPLVVTDVDGHVNIAGPGYQMQFGRNGVGAPQIPMPESLVINGSQVLDGDGDCANESHVGLALYPGLNITSAPGHLGPDGMLVSASITQSDNLNGPAAVQFVVEYTAQIRTDSVPETFTGQTTFTFFATGRIIRRDEFTPFTRPDLVAPISPFGCFGTASSFFLTSYWAFDQTGAVMVDGIGEPILNGAPAACTIYPETGTGIAVAFPPGSSTRYRVNDTASHVLDFVPEDSTSIANDFFSLTSAVQIGTDATALSACGDLLADLADLPLLINGIDFITNETGVYTDDTNHEGETVTLTSGNEVVPRGSAIILNTGEAEFAVVTRDPESSDPPAFVQRLDASHVLFVLKDQIGRGDTVSIELF